MMGKRYWSGFFLIVALWSGGIFAVGFNNEFAYDPYFCNDWKISVRGEWLYFKARIDGLTPTNIFDLGVPPREGATIGEVFVQSGVTIGINQIGSEDLYVLPKWSSGYRVGVGFIAPNSNLDMDLSYSNYWTASNTSRFGVVGPNTFAPIPLLVGNYIEQNVNQVFLSSFPIFPTGLIQTVYNDHYTLRIQDLLLKFGYAIDLGDSFTFKPYIGAMGLYIEQQMNFDYSFNFSSTTLNNSVAEFSRQNTKYYGGGLLGGLYGKYLFGFDVSLYGDLSIGLIYGKKKLTGQILGVLPTIIGTNELLFNLDRHPISFCPLLTSTFGIAYETPTFYRTLSALIKVSFERRVYFRQNFFVTGLSLSNDEAANQIQGDLCAYGLALSGEIVF